MDPEQERKPRFVVCTVGGTPEPIVFCLNSRQPEAVLYVVSEATRDEVAKRIVPNVAPRLVWSSFAVVDPDKPSSTFQAVREEMRRLLTQFKGQPGDVLADITGGTKAMAAGLALAASVMGFRLSYVAGARSEGGTGTVLSGTETPVEEINPLDWFAVPQLETANRLLAMGYPGSAARVLREASKGCSPSVRKRLQRLESLCTGLASIDRFDFRVARNQLKQPLEGSDQPERLIGWEATEALKSLIDHWQACQEIVSAGERPQDRSLRPLMLELLANARRRARRGEHDAAVACLYRAVEMFAQDRLWQAFGANRGQVPEEALPQEARQRLLERGVRPQDGKFKVALSNAFELLRFAPQSELQGSSKVYERLRSHLEKRNGSILAHGIVPLDEEGYEAMEAAVWSALEIEEGDVPMWPEIRLSLD